ncbi:MAG TPA: energy-coupling factor ABC transporter permease [Methyloradius sp.]
MNFPDGLLPATLLWIANILAGSILYLAVKTADWRLLKNEGWQHLFLGTSATLILLWSIKAGIKPALDFHMLGATLLSLMFGWQFALMALSLVLIGITAFGMAGWESLGLNFMLMGIIPALFSYNFFRWVDRKLPNHFFIYVYVTSFASAALAITLCGIAAILVLSLGGVYTGHYLMQNYLPYFILMAWSEALLTGMAVTMMAVYRPEWLITFSDKRYLNNKD